MKKHVNIPIFIPHLGCPNQCVFCNQRTISGVDEFDIALVRNEIESVLSTIDSDTEAEIAFFGGSFTGIDRELMVDLLKIAYEYVLAGKVSSIRCSTRPDYIDSEILQLLKQYGVKTIELGLQSYDDSVLRLSKRGHTSLDEEDACKLIVEQGFELVGQMMIGLPGATFESEIATARFIINSGAVGARIYPTVVFKDTELAQMLELGSYDAISLDEAVRRSTAVLELFVKNNIKVIRIGLCASDNLYDKNKYHAGPNHPALGEMVESELYFSRTFEIISRANLEHGAVAELLVPKGALSKAIGQKKINKQRLIARFGLKDIKFREDSELNTYEVRLREGKRKCI